MQAKTFTILFIVSLVLGIIGAANSIFLPLLMREEAMEYSLIGVVGALTGLGGGLAQLIAGVASDKGLDRRNLIILSTLLLSIAFSISYSTGGLLAYVLISLAVGLSTPIVITISLAIISEETPGRLMGRIISVYRISRSIGWTIGNMALGLMADIYGSRSILLCSSIFSSATLFASFKIPRGRGFIKTGKVKGRTTTDLALFLASLAIINMAASADNRFIPLLAVDNKLSKSTIGAITALGSLVEIPLMLASGVITDRFGEKIAMLLGTVGFASAYYQFTNAQTYLDFSFAQALRGMSYALYFAASLALIGRLSKGSGTVTGYYGFSQQVGSVVGPILAGLASNYMGLRETFIVLSTLSLTALTPLIPIHVKTTEVVRNSRCWRET